MRDYDYNEIYDDVDDYELLSDDDLADLTDDEEDEDDAR